MPSNVVNSVYIVYTDFGYDGICIEGVASTMARGMVIALRADPDCDYSVFVEEWPVDLFPLLNDVKRGVVVIEKGKVQSAIQKQ